MAPPRPILHLSPLLLPTPNRPLLGSRLRGRLLTHRAHNPNLRLWALPPDLPPRRNPGLFPRRKTTRTRDFRFAGQEQTTGTFWTAWERAG